MRSKMTQYNQVTTCLSLEEQMRNLAVLKCMVCTEPCLCVCQCVSVCMFVCACVSLHECAHVCMCTYLHE